MAGYIVAGVLIFILIVVKFLDRAFEREEERYEADDYDD